MKLVHRFTSLAMIYGFTMLILGLPGLAQSQKYYGAGPYVSPYDDPYFNDPHTSFENDDYDDEDNVLTDSTLRARIITDLAMSPFIDRDSIYVSVDKGIVTLSGDVEDRSEMMDAVEIAYDAGAWRVRNKLKQQENGNPGWAHMSDRELAEEIQQELLLSPFVNSDHITVRVRNGVATLYGGVENKGEIADAVENAYEAGAKRVKSRLWVDPELS